MPLGKVFDATQNQVLFSPVTNYYQGKAIRTQQAMAEKELEQADKKLELEERRVKAVEDQMRAARDKFERDVGLEAAKGYAKELYARIYAIDEAVTAGEIDEEGALESAATSFAEYAETLPQEYAVPLLEKLQDGLTIDEYRQIKANNAGALEDYSRLETDGQGAGTPTTIQKELQPLVDRGVISQQEMDELVLASHRKEDGSPRLTDRDKKIIQYQEELALSKADAVKLADGLYSVKPNPANGTVQLIDQLNRVVQEIEVDRPEVPRPTPREGETLWDLAQYATGPVNTVAAAVSIPLAWIGAPVAEKVVGARQAFSTTNQDFIRALQNNKRYPIGEREAITKEISMIPSFLDDPKLMRIRMNALRDTLGVRAAQADKDAADPNNPSAFRGGAKQAASDIRNYLAVLGEPKAPEWALKHLEENPDTIDQFINHWGYDPRESN